VPVELGTRLASTAYRALTAILLPPMPSPVAFALFALLGVLLAAGGLVGLRLIGAQLKIARRLAGARQLSVADVLALGSDPPRPVRVSGRVRTPDPINGPDDEPLVAIHRDVAVLQPGSGWRTIERLRLTRSFQLWDHAGSLGVDPAAAAEPLISIPLVWEGSADELGEPYSAAIARLAADGPRPTRARSVTRTIAVADRLLILARPHVEPEGSHSLLPPDGGYVISSLELDDAMRLLGGQRRALLAAAIVAFALGVGLGVTGAVLAILGFVLGT
jgi:hypothetical protein